MPYGSDLPSFRDQTIRLIVANAENAAGGFGLTPAIADELFDLGCDVLTTGNHVWDKREIMDYLSSGNGNPGSRPARVLRRRRG